MSANIKQSEFRAFRARYHRNGVAGEGFYLCSFLWVQGRKLQPLEAVVFAAPGRVAVIDPINIDSRWRGDDFEPALRAALAAVEKAQPESLYTDAH